MNGSPAAAQLSCRLHRCVKRGPKMEEPAPTVGTGPPQLPRARDKAQGGKTDMSLHVFVPNSEPKSHPRSTSKEGPTA